MLSAEIPINTVTQKGKLECDTDEVIM